MNRRLIHAAVPFYGNFPQRQQNEVRDVFQVQPVSQISRIETRQVQDDEVDRNEAGKLPDAKALLVNSVLDGHVSDSRLEVPKHPAHREPV